LTAKEKNVDIHNYTAISFDDTEWAVSYTLCSKKSDAKIQITITTASTAYLIRIKYPLSGFNYHLSDVNVANFNKIHRTVSEQQLFQNLNSKTEVSNMEKSH